MNIWTSPRRLMLLLFGGLVVVYLLLPALVTLPMSLTTSNSLEFPPHGLGLGWYENMLSDPGWSSSLISSIEVASGATLVSLLLGVPLAMALSRSRFFGRTLVYAITMMPLVVPSVIVAIGMFFVWTNGWRVGPLEFGGHLSGTLPGLVLAHATLALPFVVVLVSAGLQGIDPDLELAAQGLGANPLRVFRYVTLPLIIPGMLGGAVLAFLTSWDEPVIALFLTSPTLLTLPVRMFVAARESIDPTVAAVSTLVMAATAIIFTAGLLVRRES